MPVEIPRQQDMFTGEQVDVRTAAQKRQPKLNQMEMFAAREVAQFGVRANPRLPLSPKTRLELSVEDRRTEEQQEQDRMRAAEANTYSLLTQDPPASSEPRSLKKPVV